MIRSVRCFVALVAVVMLGACSTLAYSYPWATRTTPPAVPPYPDMREREQRTEEDVEGFDEEVVTFETSDDPTDVLQFYRDHLLAEGWTKVVTDLPDYITIVDWNACPLYSVSIQVTKKSATITRVETRLGYSLCMAR